MNLVKNPLNTVSVVRFESDVKLLRAEIQTLRREIWSLAGKLARYPEPPRTGWQRTVPRIAHVRIMMAKGMPQMVTSFDEDWRELPEYSGLFSEVGLRVLSQSQGIEWEQVTDPALMTTMLLPKAQAL